MEWGEGSVITSLMMHEQALWQGSPSSNLSHKSTHPMYSSWGEVALHPHLARHLIDKAISIST